MKSTEIRDQSNRRLALLAVAVLMGMTTGCRLPASAFRSEPSAADHIEAGNKAIEQRRFKEAAKRYHAAEQAGAAPSKIAERWKALARIHEGFGHDLGRQHAHRYYKRA